jgi:hypothetical protein
VADPTIPALEPAAPGLVANKAYVDQKLSAMLSATLFGGHWDRWFVYVVFDRRQYLRYVGQSGTLFSRFSQHKSGGRLGERGRQQPTDWAEVIVICCWNEIQVRAQERKLIHRFHPPDNRKCEVPGCRHYLDGAQAEAVNRTTVNKELRTRKIEVSRGQSTPRRHGKHGLAHSGTPTRVPRAK